MTAFLNSKADNTAATAYNIRLNVDYYLPWSSYEAHTVFSNKYVNLDLSGSTFTSIGRYAFEDCRRLVGVTIPASVTSIGYGAFSGCTSLVSITVAANNPSYASEGGILYNKAKTDIVYVPQGISGHVTIPNSVTSIRELAFNSLSLASVTIGNSVTSIGWLAFDRCRNLASVSIGSSVTSIEQSAFAYCTSLASITIPSSVTSIGENAFYYCTSLTSVTFAGTVSNFGRGAFDGNLARVYNGPGTYTTANPGSSSAVWRKW